MFDHLAADGQIVGNDEADIKEGRISLGSPIARALIANPRGVVVDEGAGRPQSLGDPGDARGLGRRLELAVPRGVTTALAHGDGRQCSDISGVHHLEGHLLAPLLEPEPPPFPHVALLVSGGHTMLIEAAAARKLELVRFDSKGNTEEALSLLRGALVLLGLGGLWFSKSRTTLVAFVVAAALKRLCLATCLAWVILIGLAVK